MGQTNALAPIGPAPAAPPKQAKALDNKALAAIKASAHHPRNGRQSQRTETDETARGRGDVAICFVLMVAGLRRSEAAVLTWGDIEASDDGSGLLHVRRSKTAQEAHGSVRYLSVLLEASMSFWLAKYIVPDRWA